MSVFRFISIIIVALGLLLGVMLVGSREELLGVSLIIGGAIIISGLLISSAILEKKER